MVSSGRDMSEEYVGEGEGVCGGGGVRGEEDVPPVMVEVVATMLSQS